MMEKIQPGKYVEIAYDLYASLPGQPEAQVHTVEASEPERFIYGVTPGLIPALASVLDGLAQGDPFDVEVPADQAIPFNPDDVATLGRDLFLDDSGKLDSRIKTGAKVPMFTADGYQITGTVLEVTPDHVKMDFNHPLVGHSLHFTNGKVVTVRDATPEELHPSRCGGGCGGCGGGCGDSGDSSCGTGGCCGDNGDSSCGDGGCCGGCN